MLRRVLRWVSMVIGVTLPLDGVAQTYHLRDGRILLAQQVQVRGDQLVQRVADGASGGAEIGYPLSQVSRLEWPEPDVLKQAMLEARAGRWESAMRAASEVSAVFEPFGKLPGSWWVPAEILRLKAALALGLQVQAVEVERVVERAPDEPTRQTSYFLLAWVHVRDGRVREARALLSDTRRIPVNAHTEAEAALVWGELHERQQAPEAALESFLRIPVFAPWRDDLQPRALLGSARAYRRLGDEDRCERAVIELTDQYPHSREAQLAQKEFNL
ncbi:MAG TPA: tetratricopeptide repeat protein [Opitutaceae bacterium]|nr:tetratricopeptide repeat protein [Opitutaceae bacterium]